MSTTMTCGHASMSVHVQEHDGLGKEHLSCVICSCCEQDPIGPDLTGRFAICAYSKASKPGRYLREWDHEPKPSSPDLAFFEYCGPGSERALAYCKNCSMHENAHNRPFTTERSGNSQKSCRKFEANLEGREYDSFYCGCFGWD